MSLFWKDDYVLAGDDCDEKYDEEELSPMILADWLERHPPHEALKVDRLLEHERDFIF